MTQNTLVSHVFDHVRRNPSKTAIVSADSALTYADLGGRICAAAELLRDAGVVPGDRVMLAAEAQPSFVIGYLAAHLLGAIAVPIDPKMGPEKLRVVMDQLTPRVLCVPSTMRLPEATDCSVVSTAELAGSANSGAVEASSFPDAMQPADVLLTSGTTGNPKGVVLTHENILAAATSINQFIGNGAEDREAHVLPLSHSFGLGRLRCQMVAGGTLILTKGLMFPKQLFEMMERWEATGLAFVPAGWALLTRLTGDKLAEFSDRLRYIEIGSSPMPSSEKERLLLLFPTTKICMHYGLSEASRSTFIEFHQSREKLDSIGQPAPNVQIRIADEAGRPCPPDEPGAILIRGRQVTTRYWSEPTESILVDGWLRSGDSGYQDRDGYIFLSGRDDDAIDVGGRKVYPAEIEAVLKDLPAVRDCACVGIDDPENVSGKQIKAFLVPESGYSPPPERQELVRLLRESLELYKIPSVFEWIDQIPKGTSGKVMRHLLKDAPTADPPREAG